MSGYRVASHVGVLIVSSLMGGASLSVVGFLATRSEGGTASSVVIIGTIVAAAAFIVSAYATLGRIDVLGFSKEEENGAFALGIFQSIVFHIGIIAIAVTLGGAGFLFDSSMGTLTTLVAFILVISVGWVALKSTQDSR